MSEKSRTGQAIYNRVCHLSELLLTGRYAHWEVRRGPCSFISINVVLGGLMLARMFSHPRFLVAYSALVTLAFSVSVSMGFVGTARSSGKITEFDRIRVHRIDVVEAPMEPHG